MEVNLMTIAWFLWIITWVGIRNSCCQKPNLDAILNRRQDVYIAGFFPFGKGVEQSGTGRGVMPSVKLALDHVNEHETVLRNYRLHMWWNDTECNAAVGVKSFFDMMHSGPHKLMLFGAACTHVTDPIAKASKHWHLTQLSYADTHPMFTKDAFPNFFRIVPSENAFNLPRLELLKHFNWTRVGTIYQNEPRYALAHNRLVADLDAENFIVEETQSFATEVRTALTKLKEKDIRIILGNFNETWAIRVFCEAYRLEMYGRTYQWLIQGTYSENWWRRRAPCARQHLTAALDTVILTDLLPLSTTGEVTISGITAKEYQVEYDRRRGSEYSRFHGYTYDGIWAVALAIQNVAQRAKQKHKERGVADFKYRDKDWEEMFLEALSTVSFEGVTGPVRFHNNERRASILLKQFQGEELGEVKVGEYCSELSRLDLATGLPFKWGGNRYPPKDRTLHQIEHTQVNITIYAVLASCSVLGIMLATCFLAMNIHYRNQRYIKMSSPHLNNLIIVGCILTYLSVIFLGLDSGLSSIAAFPYICTARAWLLMAGFSLAFGAMFSKTWRVHSIFTDVKLNKKVIKDYQLFMVVGVLLAIDLAIMTTWQISDPFYRATKQMEPYPHPSSEDILIVQENEYCQSERMTIFIGIIYAYKGLLLVFGAFLAWETRHVSIPALNDSKHIGLSVYNVLIMCIMGAAIALVLTDHKDALFVLIAIFIIFCTTGTLCLVFVPKLLELRRNGQPGTTDKSRMRATLRPTGKARDCRSPGAELEARLRDLRTHNHKFRRTLQARDNEIQMLLSKLGSDATSITSSVKTDSKSPTVTGRNVRLSVPPNVTKDAPSQMDTSDITSLCSLSASQGAEPEYYNVGVDRPKPQPSAPPHDSLKSDSAESVPVKPSTGGKRESVTKNVSFKNHLDYSATSNVNHNGAVRNVPEKDQLAKFPYGWTQEEPQTQPTPPPITQPPTQPSSRHQDPSESVQPPVTAAAPTPAAPAPVRSHRRTTSVSRPTAELVIQVPPPDLPLASERKIIGTERDEQAGCPLKRQMTFDAGQDLDMDKDYSTAERKKISQRRDSEKRRNNFIVAQSDLWDTNTFTYNCPKPQAATHHHSPMQRSVSEKNQRHSSQTGTPTHHSSSRESETKHHSGDRRSSNASMHSTHGASSVGGESRSSRDSLLAARGSTPEGYRDAETLRIQDRTSKRRGSEFPQPVSTPTHQSQQKRRQSCAQVRSIPDERPTPPPQPPATLAVVPATPRSPARPVLDRTDTPRHLQPHHHQSTPNVGAARQKKCSPSKTRSRRSTPTAPPPAPLSAVQPQARKMYSASSESELFECAILPIFHKLLTERHKSQPHGLNLVYGVSCPNISIKCDIVEYL